MTIFFDDFERANGALGGNWTGVGTPMTISGGSAISTSYSYWWNTSVSSGTRQDCTVHEFNPTDGTNLSGPCTNMGNGSQCFWATIERISSVWYGRIWYADGSSATLLVSSALATAPFPYNKMQLVWNLGHLTYYLNDVLVAQVDNGNLGANAYMGFRTGGNNTAVTDFRAVGGTPPLLSLDPPVIGNYGACVPVTLTGTNTAWTAGTPGTPIFTVDHGSISAQTVTDSTHATLTYCPGSYLGAVIFRDPSTGETVGGLVTSDPTIVPPGAGGGLSQTAIDYIERSAIAESGGTIVNREQSINAFAGLQTLTETITTINAQVTTPTQPVAGVGSLLAFVIEIFDLINGGNNWGGAATVFGNTSLIKSGVDDANTAISDLRGAGGVTLATLAAALSNLRGVGQPSLADILSAVGTPDLGPLSDKLDAMRGDTTTSLSTLLSSLGSIRTVDALSLGDVMDALDNLGGSSPVPTALAVVGLVAALALAAPTGGASVAAAALAVGAGPVLDIATIVELVSVLGELATIAADVASIKAQPSGGTTGAPVWPGASKVSLGTSHALSDGLVVAGPLDGLIVAVTGHPSGAGKYAFGSVTSWQHCGAVLFANDRGDYERAESFGLDSQLITPRTMAQAASAIVRLNGGWSGTVRSWVATS